MKDWVLYIDDTGHELLCRRTRNDPYDEGAKWWEYEVAATRHVENTRWIRPARPEYRTFDQQSPEFREQTKEHVTAILLRAERDHV